MTEGDVPRLVYLVLLGIFIFGLLIGPGRRSVGAQIKHVLTWAGIFAMLIIAYSQRDIVMAELFPATPRQIDGATIALNRSPGGSFEATLRVNGTPVWFLVDTGATEIVLSLQDAERVGIDTDRLHYDGIATTANGTVETASVRLDSVGFAQQLDTNVRASVNGGALGVSLLGMTYLDRFERIEISGNRMLLIR